MVEDDDAVLAPVRYCVHHPGVETVVSCGRCDAPLCPPCMIFTPVGVRCKDCAQLRRLPQYQMTRQVYLRVIPSALALALVTGYLLSLVPLHLGFLGGFVVGLVVGEGLRRLSGYKQGREMEVIAGATVIVAVLSSSVFPIIRLLGLDGLGLALNIAVGPQTFLYNALGIVIGVFLAIQRLR